MDKHDVWPGFSTLLRFFGLSGSGARPVSGGSLQAAAEPALEVVGVCQSWPAQPEPLFCVGHLRWHRGAHIWLQGANGSGKTTLMRLLSGLEPVQSGEIRQAGLNPVPRICYLHQSPYLFAGSVEQNLRFVLRSLKGQQRVLAAEALDTGLALAGLTALRRQQAVTLSGGERQRLALLRAWLLQPEWLLLDEPTANLDDDSVLLIGRLVQDLVDKGCSVMISSHQENLLTDLCRNRWVIHQGQVSHRAVP